MKDNYSLNSNQAKPSINAQQALKLSPSLGAFDVAPFNVTGYTNSTLVIRFSTDVIKRSVVENYILEFNGNKINLGDPFFTLRVKIRPCVLGEIYQLQSLQCDICKNRFYTLDLESTSCNDCPDGVESCFEGYRMIV